MIGKNYSVGNYYIYEEPESAPSACGGDESVIALGFPKGAQHPFGQGWGECPTCEGEACSARFALPPSLLMRNFYKVGQFGGSSFWRSERQVIDYIGLKENFLHGIIIAMYIAGQERRLVNPPSQVVAGVRTVATF